MTAQNVYATPDILVTTDWLEENLDLFLERSENPRYRLVESNEDPLLYQTGHIPGAIEIDWTRDLNHPIKRDYISKEQFQELLRKKGIGQDTTVVFYGDKNNWWAAYTLWMFSLFNFNNVKLLDGGKIKWEQEGRPLSKDIPSFSPTTYVSSERDDTTNRAFRSEVIAHSTQGDPLIDVRSPEEFAGQRLHIPGYPNEGAVRGGHIPGAVNIPWASAVKSDGTFKDYKELEELYLKHLDKDKSVIVYCRIGERSAHTWFVLKYLLGFSRVKNYDGSWTEYGNLVNVQIENPSAVQVTSIAR